MNNTDDIELIKEQTAYMNEIRKQLSSTGKVILEAGDTDTIDKIAQTLNWFRMYLSTFDGVKTKKG
jgi:hypothetical protein